MFRINTDMRPSIDYSQEARNLWARLGIDPDRIDPRGYNPLDIIYKSEQGGCIYVGGERAARDIDMIRENRIAAIVNCTTDIRNYNEGRNGLVYFNFDVASWKRHVHAADDQVDRFLGPMLRFVCKHVFVGENVLVHCLAGAHRAGTTGIICLMHFAGLQANKAISTARSLRNVIDPISDFRQLLRRCDELERNEDGTFTFI